MGWAEFFRTAPGLPDTGADADGSQRPPQGSHESQHAADSGQHERKMLQAEGAANQDSVVPPAEFVQPLYISKLNTVFQLGLIAGCISHSWYSWPSEDVLWGLGGVTALATLASFAAYVQVYRRGAIRSKV